MVEKLKAYRAELEAKKAMLENSAIDVEAEVAAYREKLITAAEAERAATIAKLISDMNCIDGIIAREEEKGTAEVTVDATPTDSVE